MTGPASQLILLLLLMLPASYVIGRVHQWYTNSLRRDLAFRQGYDHASHTMFDLAVQEHATAPPAPAAPPLRRTAEGRPRTLRIPALPVAPAAGRRRSAEQPRTRILPQARTGERSRTRVLPQAETGRRRRAAPR